MYHPIEATKRRSAKEMSVRYTDTICSFRDLHLGHKTRQECNKHACRQKLNY